MSEQVKILIVEDESIVALNIRHRLEEIGYKVVSVVSQGEEAVEIAASTRPDLALIDIRLPGRMDGIEAAEQIRTRLKIPFVYLSAYTDKETLERAKLTQPYGYIVKPFQTRELYSAIEIALYKHQSEQELKAREQWLATTLHSIGDAVITTDRDGNITFMNPVAENLTGWKQAEAKGNSLSQVFRIIDERTRSSAANPVAIALQQGVTVSLENHILLVKRDGTEIPIDDSAAPIKDEAGTVTGAVLVFHDIIERKQAEQALQNLNQELEVRVEERTQELNRRQQQLVALVENAPDIIARLDRELRHLYVNPAVELATGLSRQEFIGKTNRELGMPLELVVFWEQEFRDVFATGQEKTMEFSFPTPDGLKYYQVRIVPELTTDGTVVSVLSISRDITALKHAEIALRASEERFRTSIENMLDAFAIFSAVRDESGKIVDFRYEYINHAGCVANHETLPEILGKTMCEFLPGHRETGLLEAYCQVVETGQPLVRESLIYEDVYNGKRLSRAFDFQATKLGDGFAVAWRDVTERKQAEEQIKASLKEKEVLLKEVHHRVKNNLQIISSLIKLQSYHIQDVEASKIFLESQNRVRSMALIHEKLYQSQNLASINFADYIRNLASELMTSYGVNRQVINLQINAEDINLNLDTMIPAGLIMNELVSNALKYAFPAGQLGEIRINFSKKTDNQYELVVSDNGVGLPESIDFENTETLGLQIVCNLTQQLNGTIELDRSKGTRFKITFVENK